MLSSTFIKLSALLLLAKNVAGDCYSTETPALMCYTGPGNTPQDVDVADITFAAAYLRAYGKQLRAGRFFNMLTTDGSTCPEWSLYQHNSVLITAKHIDSTVNSSVLFTDIANTIDGGVPVTISPSLYGCGSDGGALGVAYNATNPSYTTAAYLASGYVPSGIIIKVVWSGA